MKIRASAVPGAARKGVFPGRSGPSPPSSNPLRETFPKTGPLGPLVRGDPEVDDGRSAEANVLRAGARGEPRRDRIVPITASGLQGEQPLAKRTDVGQGSRQNGLVTSGQEMAPKAGREGPGDPGVRSGFASGQAGGRRWFAVGSVPEPRAGSVGGRRGFGRGVGSFRRSALPFRVQRPIRNRYGLGESDCLIKTKRRDGPSGC